MTQQILYISYKIPAGAQAYLFPVQILLVFNIQTAQNVVYTCQYKNFKTMTFMHAVHVTAYK